MKKKQINRLKLNRETIQHLGDSTLTLADAAVDASSQVCCPVTTAYTGGVNCLIGKTVVGVLL
jgi:hypothetical protein